MINSSLRYSHTQFFHRSDTQQILFTNFVLMLSFLGTPIFEPFRDEDELCFDVACQK